MINIFNNNWIYWSSFTLSTIIYDYFKLFPKMLFSNDLNYLKEIFSKKIVFYEIMVLRSMDYPVYLNMQL